MGQNDFLVKAKPQLNVKEFQDLYLRKNFENLKDYFSNENQLLSFKFFEVSFSGAVSNQKVSHGLGVVPQDIIATRISGPGTVQFNWNLFDNKSMDLTSTGACRIRFFAGSYWNFNTALNNASTDITQYFALAASSQSSAKSEQVFSISSFASGNYTSTIADANNVILIDAGTADATTNPGAFAANKVTLPPVKLAFGTGRYTFKKVDNTFNQINIVTQVPDTYAYTTDTVVRLSTQGETASFIATRDKWVLVDRAYRGGWTSLNWVATSISTNALANAVNFNVGAGFESPIALWRRTENFIHMRFAFNNGPGAATGTAGIISIPTVANVIADPTQIFFGPGGGPNYGPSHDGYVSIMNGTTFTAVVSAELQSTYSLTPPTYFRVKKPATNTYYTLTDIVGGFSMRGDLYYPIAGWET